MCFTVPQKIERIEKDTAFFKNGISAKIDLEKCAIGDYALVQKGYVVKKLNKKEAKQVLELLGG